MADLVLAQILLWDASIAAMGGLARVAPILVYYCGRAVQKIDGTEFLGGRIYLLGIECLASCAIVKRNSANINET